MNEAELKEHQRLQDRLERLQNTNQRQASLLKSASEIIAAIEDSSFVRTKDWQEEVTMWLEHFHHYKPH